MKYFLEFIEASKNNLTIKENVQSKLLEEMLEEAEPFVFSQDPPNLVNLNPKYQQLSLPFKCISIEYLDNYVTKIDNSITKCLLVKEIDPEVYQVFILVEDKLNGNIYIKNSPNRTIMNGMIAGILKDLDHQKVGIENVRQRVKLGTGKDKKFHTIRKIIHICPKDSIQKTYGNKKVDWTHRFSIRGHWRNLGEGKLGKNREGTYCVDGMTWVREYKKGPEDKEFIKKVRLV